MSQQDMTPKEAQAALTEIRNRVGGKCEASILLNDDGRPWYGAVRPLGYGPGEPRLSTNGDTLAEVIGTLRIEAANWLDQRIATVTRRLALKIITITADTGACTEAALRQCGEFTTAEIAAYGPTACNEADKLASNGPFTITPTPSNQNEAA